MAKFDKKNEITELCKGVHCVDLDESFQTHIFSQNFVSIQPRTSPPKFLRNRGPSASGVATAPARGSFSARSRASLHQCLHVAQLGAEPIVSRNCHEMFG